MLSSLIKVDEPMSKIGNAQRSESINNNKELESNKMESCILSKLKIKSNLIQKLDQKRDELEFERGRRRRQQQQQQREQLLRLRLRFQRRAYLKNFKRPLLLLSCIIIIVFTLIIGGIATSLAVGQQEATIANSRIEPIDNNNNLKSFLKKFTDQHYVNKRESPATTTTTTTNSAKQTTRKLVTLEEDGYKPEELDTLIIHNIYDGLSHPNSPFAFEEFSTLNALRRRYKLIHAFVNQLSIESEFIKPNRNYTPTIIINNKKTNEAKLLEYVEDISSTDLSGNEKKKNKKWNNREEEDSYNKINLITKRSANFIDNNNINIKKDFNDQKITTTTTINKDLIINDFDKNNNNEDDGEEFKMIKKVRSDDEKNMMMNNSDNYIKSNNVRCFKNKFDRLIAQKMSSNELSRPIIESDGRFNNPFDTWKQMNALDLAQWVLLGHDDTNLPTDLKELDSIMPILKPNFSSISQLNFNEFRVTWIGHSTLLIQINGFNILTDPIFSDRASATQLFGPKRFRPPACNIKSLPKIDIVLISHNHFDHLDSNSVQELNERFGVKLRWLVPLGLGDFFKSMSIENYVELDWWQKDCFKIITNHLDAYNKTRINKNFENNNNNNRRLLNNSKSETEGAEELAIYLTPSQHWSRRGVNDNNKSLWGSYTIVSANNSTFLFGGDTGYCKAFKEIGNIFGPFTGAALPIGAYSPRWFMKFSHVDPGEAIQIHRDIRSMKSMAIHHSTFALANEFYREPVMLLNELMEEQKQNGTLLKPFVAIKHGESLKFCKNC